MIVAEVLLHLPLKDHDPQSGVWATSQQGFKPSTTCRSLSLPGIPDWELTGDVIDQISLLKTGRMG